MLDSYIRAVTFLSRVTGLIAALMIGAAVLVICDLVIERYVLNLNTIWQIDMVTYLIVAATFIGSGYVLLTRGHVNVDLVPLHVTPQTRYWLAVSTGALALGFVLILFILTTLYWHEAWAQDWHSDTVWRAPLWAPYLSMPIGLGVLLLQYIADLLSVITGRTPPFGMAAKEDAEDIARAHAREALGETP